ncbi:DNA polymerase-4 [Desulfonispora thiosulfatigenes DSM 11270]|uniref:DNA polymerase IV n=1 Tax=Desulfonispora thiosulfatigenes DSM 11270 TaxID=656914 RepID=A0A1W1UJ43_DESTI|nr:DNA polymerase IV [Desulfonispora thiosulfatigenes]SMB81059.1 DNA polymerase-4 [Desulfonispora thiosulfatigenes DSM 11270]
MHRYILHCDLNNFYASVECMLNPELKGKAVAVCGKQEERHGIVLAKSEKAKKMGVKTGEAICQAKRKCPDLITVLPNFATYIKYSKLTRDIYYRYTDMVEAFGIDECWLDVTGSISLFGNSYEIAYKIKETVKEELGLTISIGVSFNKIFAKLGSDMKKPDAITCIERENFKEQIWNLPAGDLLGVGSATKRKLEKYGIKTIGQIANTTQDFMKRLLGKNGTQLWMYANGLDDSRVATRDYFVPYKTIGHSITCTSDLLNLEEVWCVFLELSQNVSKRLRAYNLTTRKIQISIKDNTLVSKEYQGCLDLPTSSYHDIAKFALKIFIQKHIWINNIRAVGVRAIDLQNSQKIEQCSLFCDHKAKERINKLEETIETIRDKYGSKIINNAVLMVNSKTPDIRIEEQLIMPSAMYR